jgi:hypothetical protein
LKVNIPKPSNTPKKPFFNCFEKNCPRVSPVPNQKMRVITISPFKTEVRRVSMSPHKPIFVQSSTPMHQNRSLIKPKND